MRVLICDDEEQFISPLKEHVTRYMEERKIPCDITATTNAYKVQESAKAFDIAFLDIQMPGLDGISLAKEFRLRNGKTALFFITNYEIYQDDAMDLQALRYFTKPFSPDRLTAGLDRAMEFISDAYVDLFLYSDSVQQRVLVDDVIYLAVEGRKVAIQTTEKRFLTPGKLTQWADHFPHYFFRQAHKSFLVNLHHVERYAYSELIMSDKTRIPIAPKKRAEFRAAWFDYLGRR